MGRKRKGDGVQRSRWERRDASLNPDEPQPLNPESATGEVRTNKIAALVERRQAGFILVLEDPFNVNNAGAVLRSADAFGVTEAWIVQNGIEEGTSMRKHVEQTEKFEDDTIGLARMSSSASRWVKTRFFYSTQSAVDELKEKGFVNVATCFTAKSKSMYQTELTAPNLALWIGNEFAGLSDEALKAADLEMFIPMRGMIQSLNLSVASAICLNEVTRQRMCLPGEGGEERWLLPQEEQNRLAADLHQRRRGFRPLSGERKTRLQKTWRSVEPGEEGWVPGLDSNPDASVLSDDGETQEGGDRHRGVHA